MLDNNKRYACMQKKITHVCECERERGSNNVGNGKEREKKT